MVSIGHGKEGKGIARTLNDLQQYRKLLHRTYCRLSDGDQYVAIMVAHDQSGKVNFVVQLAAMPQVKEIVPVDLFKCDFEQVETYNPPPKAERANGVVTT